MIQLEELVDNGMPSAEEKAIVEEFGDWLDVEIKRENTEKSNALFLARITWNGTTEIIWRVYNAEITNELLKDLLKKKNYDRPFDYRIDPDKEWKLAEWHLNN